MKFNRSYLVGCQRLDVGLGLELGQRDDLGAHLEPERHDCVHGVDVEEGEDGDGHVLVAV